MKIKIDGKDYEINVETAKACGVLTEIISYPLKLGDVYYHPQGEINNFLLTQALYKGEKCYQLLSTGVSPNSDSFFHELHDSQEIDAYLRNKGMVFLRNVRSEIFKLIDI